ncbi:hypothetical protein LZ009_04385 [Ramlibacter sp. XY19]|uniref:hypothetical protein n=1 Tax=Ramlibacter paludis TaxID=2908000 RepID=UPI0023DB6075|nr:hypothetical protein [Ramlibacter paludis]MCG2592013.1 hypothetical protein [Ramlibacter paludis]
MTSELQESEVRAPSRLARSLRLVAGIVALLLLSEAIWLWQTWPVRQLVRPQAPAQPIASGR